MALFIFDFDHTIVNGHTHNYLMENLTEETKNNPKKQWDLVKHMQPIGSPKEWLDLFKQLRDAGHQIAFASFGIYGNNIIPRYLQEIIGVRKEWLDEMVINSWLPEDMSDSKNKHIEQIVEKLKYKDVSQTIVLVDDSISILLKAKEAGYSVIEATNDAKHLDYAVSASDILNMKNEKSKRGLVFGNTLEEKILGREPFKFFVVSSNDVANTVNTAKLKNCFVLTSEGALYQVDQRGSVEQYPVSKIALLQCLEKNKLTSYLNAATEKPLAIGKHVSDAAMDDINQLIMAALMMPEPSASSATVFSAPVEKSEENEVDNASKLKK